MNKLPTPSPYMMICEEVEETKTDTGVIIEVSETPTKTYRVLKAGEKVKEFENALLYIEKRGGKDIFIKGRTFKIIKKAEILAFEIN